MYCLSLSLLEQIGLERGFNIYELLELAKNQLTLPKAKSSIQ